MDVGWHHHHIVRRDWNSALASYLKVELLEHTEPIKIITQEVSVVGIATPTEQIEQRLLKLAAAAGLVGGTEASVQGSGLPPSSPGYLQPQVGCGYSRVRSEIGRKKRKMGRFR